MKHVPPYALWLGHAGDGRDFRSLFDHEIQAVLQLALDEPVPSPPRELLWFRVPLVDGSGNDPKHVCLAVSTLVRLLTMRIPTLVCCSGGLSRTPVIAASALAEFEGKTPEESLEWLGKQRSWDVSVTLWEEVLTIIHDSRMEDFS